MFDSIKRALFVDAPEATAQKGAVQTAQPMSQPATFSGQAAPALDQNHAKFIELLQGVVRNRNTAFTQLLTISDRMQSVIPDAGMRLKAALASLEGRSKQDVMQALQLHIADIKSQPAAFKNSLTRAVQDTKNTLQSKITSTQAQIDSSNARLSALQQEIATILQAVNDAQGVLVAAQSELQSVENKAQTDVAMFDAAVTHVLSELQLQESTISNTL